MDPQQAHAAGDDVFLLDVREPAEWQAGHIEGAVHVPMSQLAARQDELPTDRRIVCVCRSGQRSHAVTQALSRAGYDAKNLDGGLLAWVEAGLDLKTQEGQPGRVI